MSGPPRAPQRRDTPAPPSEGRGEWSVRLAGFVSRYGWRAYALPVLVVVTIVGFSTVFDGGHTARRSAPAPVSPPTDASSVSSPSPSPSPSSASTPTPSAGDPSHVPAGPRSSQVKVDSGGQSEDVAADALPPGPAYTKRGDGTYRDLPGTTAVVGTGGAVRTYVIQVENGVTGVDLAAYAELVDATLDAPKGWTGGDHGVSLQRVASSAQADFRIALTSSLTLRPPCGHDLNIETSCWDDQHGPSRVYLNVARWVRGDAQFGQDLAAYHLYMINHEVGHALGHHHTYVCLPNGLAPVMMQQTITLTENQGKGPDICQPNVWPYPTGVDPRVAVPT